MMTVDNLPTQLPRDASEYFGACLTPVIKGYIDNGLDDADIRRAAITVDGQIVPRFQNELQHLVDSIQAKTVLIVGAGFVAKPVIEYLLKFPEYSLIIAAPAFDHISSMLPLLKRCKNVTLLKESVSNGALGRVEDAIGKADMVISLLPATLHPLLLPSILHHRKHLVTASYISPQMEAFHDQAKDAGLTWLNEMGLDPGLDHMSAMQIIDGVQSEGKRVESFISWCGGLPAPECADNPIGYKFSWSPRGALLATQNASRHLENGVVVEIAGDRLLSSARPVRLHPAFAFEGLPNRDSLKYVGLYGLESATTMFRGTLRYSVHQPATHLCLGL